MFVVMSYSHPQYHCSVCSYLLQEIDFTLFPHNLLAVLGATSRCYVNFTKHAILNFFYALSILIRYLSGTFHHGMRTNLMSSNCILYSYSSKLLIAPGLCFTQEEGFPDINVVCERLTVSGVPTRFEDQARLPVRHPSSSSEF